MVEIEDKIVSDDLFEEYFCCDLDSCKGICCVEGDAGAPLDADDIENIDANIETIREYMTEEGRNTIDEQGIFVIDSDGDFTTPLINGAECAYCVQKDGITFCAIERAARDGKIDYLKPISCHLYPIRLSTIGDMTALNYHRWDVCKSAVSCGKAKGIKVYQALKEPIVRAFGEEFFSHLIEVEKYFEEQKQKGE